MKLISERKLIIGLRAGNYDSYKLLFDEYYVNFTVFVKKIVKDSQIAEDIVQEAFTKLYINRTKLDESKSLNSYLYVLVKRQLLNYLRDSAHEAAIDDRAFSLISGISVEDRNLDIRELEKIVLDAVEAMPAQRREVFRLSRFKGLSNKEIAEALNLSVRTVEHHISFALAEIRKAMGA